jgi:hypothetical protein
VKNPYVQVTYAVLLVTLDAPDADKMQRYPSLWLFAWLRPVSERVLDVAPEIFAKEPDP